MWIYRLDRSARGDVYITLPSLHLFVPSLIYLHYHGMDNVSCKLECLTIDFLVVGSVLLLRTLHLIRIFAVNC